MNRMFDLIAALEADGVGLKLDDAVLSVEAAEHRLGHAGRGVGHGLDLDFRVFLGGVEGFLGFFFNFCRKKRRKKLKLFLSLLLLLPAWPTPPRL